MENMVIDFNQAYRGKKVLVTGNTGFKGSWLCTWLTMIGAKVYGISSDVPTDPALFEVAHLRKQITYIEQDVRDFAGLKKTIDTLQPEFIFHLAAQAIVSRSYSDPLLTIQTNVLGTTNMLEVIRLATYPVNAIFITSDKCYENKEWIWGYRENDQLGGKDIYSASKAAAEVLIHAYMNSFLKASSNVRVLSVRAGNVIGGGDWAASRIVPDAFRAWSSDQTLDIRSPDSTRPWQHVLEPVGGYLRAGAVLATDPKLSGESYNFGPLSDQNFSVLDLIRELSTHWSRGTQQPLFSVSRTSHFHEAGLLKLNCDKALQDFQWKPVLDFNQTAKFTAEWYNRYYNSSDAGFEFTQSQIREYCVLAQQKKLRWTL